MILEIRVDVPGDVTEELVAAVVPIHRSNGNCVQWPIARIAVRGQDVQCYHSGAFIGFDVDGRHWLIPLVPIVDQIIPPTHIGNPPPAEASADIESNHQHEE